MRYMSVLWMLLCALAAKPQSFHIGGLFPTLDHSGMLGKKWNYGLYYFGAFNVLNPELSGKRDVPHLGAFYAENALSYNADDHWSFTGAYVYERQNVFRDTYRNENRFYVQSTYKWNSGKTGLKLRLRYDGRFIENRTTQEWPYTSRLRLLMGASRDLTDKPKWYAAAYQEFFFNTYSASPVIYAENWAFAGLGYRFRPGNAFEFGPLYIFWVNNPRYDLTNFYYLQFTWVNLIRFKN